MDVAYGSETLSGAAWLPLGDLEVVAIDKKRFRCYSAMAPSRWPLAVRVCPSVLQNRFPTFSTTPRRPTVCTGTVGSVCLLWRIDCS